MLQQLQCFDALVAEGNSRLRPTACRVRTDRGDGDPPQPGGQSGLPPGSKRLSGRPHRAGQGLSYPRPGPAAAGRRPADIRPATGHGRGNRPSRRHRRPVPAGRLSLRTFFEDNPATRLELHFEAISGPWERLADDEANLILHHIDKSHADVVLSRWRVWIGSRRSPGAVSRHGT